MTDVIEVEGLHKTYGEVRALEGLDLTVGPGSIVGMLGPNGAGKTTTVRVLATLLRPDSGAVRVCGVDALREPQRVRPLIGLTGQYAAVDEKLTGAENLRMLGRLFRRGRGESATRAGELLEQFGLTDAAKRLVRTYSGGMRRRLDLAASLIARPQVLFLDEPTTGLDPRSRARIWQVISDLAAEGTTVLLTTQYLEEADQLADSIAVVDHGKVIARGSPDELKSRVGEERLEILLVSPADEERAADVVASVSGRRCSREEEGRLVVAASGAAGLMPELMRALDEAGIRVLDAVVRRPTLDDVFFALTGDGPAAREAREAGGQQREPAEPAEPAEPVTTGAGEGRS